MGGKPAHTVVDSQAVKAVLDKSDADQGLAFGSAPVNYLSAPPGDGVTDARNGTTAGGGHPIDKTGETNSTAFLAGTAGFSVALGSGIGNGSAHADDEPSAWDASEVVTELYKAHYNQLVRLAVMLVHDVQTAEEVVQDAFEAMHLAWRRLRDREKALSYLRQSIVNKSRSVLRHRKVVEMHAPKPAPDEQSAEHAALTLIERSAVTSALRTLPARQREAIVLRYYGDFSEADIAEAMGISRGAVKSHTARAMAALKSILEES